MGCGSASSTHSNEPKSTLFDPHLQEELSSTRLDNLGRSVDIAARGARPGDNAAMRDLMDKEAEETEETAMRPYKAAIKEPSSLFPLNQRAPNVHLKLEYIYGYSSLYTRQNLFYTANPSKIVYPASAVGVVLDTSTNSQRFFGAGSLATVNGHSDTISALTIHPNRDLVASGDLAPIPKISIWHSSDLSLVKEFRLNCSANGVACMAFSPSGRLLAACDLHNEHYVRVYDWAVGALVGEDKTGVGRILSVGWGSEEEMCTVGVKHVCFWSKRTGGFLQRKGIIGDLGLLANYTCVGWLSPSLCITGSTNGFLYSWSPPYSLRKYPICPASSAIHCLCIYKDSLLLGCSDGTIHILDKGFREVGCVRVQACPRALDMVEKRILCGCRDGSIVEMSVEGRRVGVHMESHCGGGVWGVALDTKEPRYVLTVGDDNKLKIWDWSRHKCITTVALETAAVSVIGKGNAMDKKAQGCCVAVSPNGHIAVGHGDGHIVVRREPNIIIASISDSKSRIQTLSYSPSGDLLAAGSHDNAIYLYSVASAYSLRSKLTGHCAAVTSMDFSEDSLYLHSTSLVHDLLFWDLATGQQLPSGSSLLRDEDWATWTALHGYPIEGICSPHCDITHVQAVDRKQDGLAIAVGNAWGLIELFGYPNGSGARSVAYRAHSGAVVAVKWTPKDQYLFSVGGTDNCLMQWACS